MSKRKPKPPIDTYDEAAPLDRVPGEPLSANNALRDYYRFGDGRSLAKLLDAYKESTDADRFMISRWKGRGPTPPTRRRPTIEGWSVRFRWVERVARQVEIDAHQGDEYLRYARRQIEEAALEDVGRLREILRESLDAIPEQFRQISAELGREIAGSPSINVRLDVSTVKDAVAALDKMDIIARRTLGMTERREHIEGSVALGWRQVIERARAEHESEDENEQD